MEYIGIQGIEAQIVPPSFVVSEKTSYRAAMQEFLELSAETTMDASMNEVLAWRDEGRSYNGCHAELVSASTQQQSASSPFLSVDSATSAE